MEGSVGFSGSLATQHIKGHLKAPLWWKVKNSRNLLRGWRIIFGKLFGLPMFYATLHAQLIRYVNGVRQVVDYGLVSVRVVTTAFAELMVDQLQTETSVWGDFKYHDSGTGVGAEDVGDVGLGTPSTEQVGDDRATGTQTEGTSVQYRSVGTITYDGTGGAITEHGLFNTLRGTGPTLMDRSKFDAINVVATDAVTFTYTLSVTAGG